MQIEEKPASPRFALFELGFRPFFSAAGLFAVVSMALWMLRYEFSVSLPVGGLLSPVTWHAHEMIYGYAMAVIAGFLLTAVSNWTGIRTWHGAPLVALLACWLVARVAWLLPLADSQPLHVVDWHFPNRLDGGFRHVLDRVHPAAHAAAY